MEIDIEEIRKLREDVETLRRDIARLNGNLDVIEDFIQLPKLESDADVLAELEDLQKKHAELKADSVGKVFRYLRDDPGWREHKSLTVHFRCLHQVEHVIVADSIAFLSNSLFDTPCECCNRKD